jgi:uncharacterized repeat protein (TIGR03847 family)
MIDFGVANHIEARAAGDPGHRVFHLRVLGQSGHSAALKLEKEHLVGLHTGVASILADEGSDHVAEPSIGVVPYPPTADYEFPVGRAGLGFDKESRMVVLQLEELQTEEGQDLGAMQVRFTLEQGAALVRQLEEIIGAGRPVCTLCGAPIDPGGHVCIRTNGHSQQPVPRPPDADQA